MADGESHVTSCKGDACLVLCKPMLNSSTLKAIFKKSGQWPLNTIRLIVLYVTQLKNPRLVLMNPASLLRNLRFKPKSVPPILYYGLPLGILGVFPENSGICSNESLAFPE